MQSKKHYHDIHYWDLLMDNPAGVHEPPTGALSKLSWQQASAAACTAQSVSSKDEMACECYPEYTSTF